MSEYTREEILKMIEENGGPQNLDLSGKDLSGIDLGNEAMAEEQKASRWSKPGEYYPPWYYWKKQGVNLLKATLKEANLSGAHLQWATLRAADLEGANLEDAQLEAADLREAHLEGAILTGTRLEWADLGRARLEGAYLAGAHLREAQLRWAHLEGANLEGANLEEAVLQGAHLQGANVKYANLSGADLSEAHLEKVDLSQAERLAGAWFSQAWLDQTRMKKEQLGGRIGEEIDKEYYDAKEAYLLLKNNFNQIGRYDDASWAYVKERQMEKMTYHPKLARKYYAEAEKLPKDASWRSWKWWRFYAKYTLKWLWDWIIWWLCGYGESPGKVVRVAIIVLLAFPLFYWLTGLTPPNGQNILWRDYFLYSLYAFGSMEHPTLQPTSWIAQLFTGLESLSGIALLALLMYTLGRRISRS